MMKLCTLYNAYSNESKKEYDSPLGCRGLCTDEDDLDSGDATEQTSPFDLAPGRGTGERVLLIEAIRTNSVTVTK